MHNMQINPSHLINHLLTVVDHVDQKYKDIMNIEQSPT
jgi:hypothetical protein